MRQQPVLGTPSTMGDDEQLTLTRLFRGAASSFPDQAIRHRTSDGEWKATDYAHAWERARRLAGALTELGVGPGTQVGALLWNDLRHFETYFGIPMTGGTMTQLNLRLAPQDLAYVVEHSRTGVIIVDESLLDLAEHLRPHISPDTRWIIATDRPIPSVWADRPGVYSYEDLLASAAPLSPLPEIDERTAAAACYTSGTTGRPKGIYYSNRSCWLNAMAEVGTFGLSMTDTVLLLTPMFHATCWGLPFAAMSVGAEILLPGRFTHLETDMLTDAIVEFGATLVPAAPAILLPMLHRLEQLPEVPAMPNLRFISGATEPPISMMRGFHDLLGAEIYHAYGATETGPLGVVNRLRPAVQACLDDEAQWDLRRYQGLPVVGVELKVVDPMGVELPRGEEGVGEILFRGPWITREYADAPEASATGFTEDGWWRSGDLGFITESGYVKVVDRLKDVIKSGGEWISTIDLENHILTVPGVTEASVIGVAHPKWQERPIALVATAAGADVTESQIRDVLSSRFASWQLPDKIVFVTEIARTSVGKIDKKRLRQTYADALTAGPDDTSAPTS